MKKNKRAFTLGEVLMVFIIIGIIATVGVATVKPWERAYKYAYTHIYNSLSTAIYNHMVTSSDASAFPSTPSSFCNALIEYLNTSNNAANSAETNPCNLTGGKNDFLGNTPSIDDFLEGGQNPKIKLSNGAYLWIGSNGNEPFSYTQNVDSSNDTIKYYLVYADLNGNMGPNTAAYNKRLPDIVAFAVTDKFAVIPLGYPKIDQRYLSAHIMYPITEEDDVTDEGERPSDAMTYYEALVGAYGKGAEKIITIGLPETYNLEANLPDGNIFKFANENDLDSKYANAPVFDQGLCGDGYTPAQLNANGNGSHCSIKIYNYN